METTLRNCLCCGKMLRGRSDKKYCDDYCRNNFNNRQNSDQNNYVRNINYILRRNRRILESVIPVHDDKKKVHREQLVLEGFNFRYHTHQYQTQKGDIYLFNYEYGYLPLENDWLLVVKRRERKEGQA